MFLCQIEPSLFCSDDFLVLYGSSERRVDDIISIDFVVEFEDFVAFHWEDDSIFEDVRLEHLAMSDAKL